MKRIILPILIIIGLSACRKDRSCVCTQNGTEVGRAEYTHVKKSEAQTYCQAIQNQYTSSSGVTCVVN